MKRPSKSALGIVASILSAGLALAVCALLLFAWLAEEVAEGDTLAFDNSVREFVYGHSSAWLTAAMQGISFIGSAIFLTVATLAILAVLLRTRHRHSAILFGIAMIGASVLNFVLKIAFLRERPVPYFDAPPPSSYSFPSGHALCSLCFYGALAWVWAAHPVGDRRRILAWMIAVLLVFSIGSSRIYLGMHYPSDVIAGYLAGFVWIISVFGADAWFARKTAA